MRKIIGEKNDRMRDFGNKPNQDYFNELFRITKNQIIWGANNFIENLYSTNCFIFWYKGNPMENYSDGEMAWTSFSKVAKCFDYRYYGSLSGNTKAVEKIHPTQKPIQLYNWILKNYGDKDFKILDTHLGSGSSAIASFYFGCKEFVGMEIDKYYYDKSIKRIKQQTAQIKLF
jgi:site-specific DNA-methyltransferase (adenine-specific)